MTTTTRSSISEAAHEEAGGRESVHVMCSEKMETSVADNQKNKLKLSPVTVTKFDSFYMSLRAVENERRNHCSDSLRRLRLRRYRGEKMTQQLIIDNNVKEEDDGDDEDVFHIGDFEIELENESSSHEVVQHAYGATKEVWAWGKTVPVLSNVLGLTEGVTSKFFEITIHVDDVEKDLVIPNLKKLDDEIVSPSIGTILKIIGPAMSVGEEVLVKPALHHIVQIPFLGQLILGEKKEDEVKDIIDHQADGSSL
ncbi:hypothetical protein QTG54_004444 [Skeletonema marinoi]|uniref:Uncharacterized protein n=1 Tax=Skeletonema marinoi TaxID=267567 RepID=A0AAD9DGV7_9STRA|nr:hypothetical protein QTG54_004444 [Skeletonema marinoi]